MLSSAWYVYSLGVGNRIMSVVAGLKEIVWNRGLVKLGVIQTCKPEISVMKILLFWRHKVGFMLPMLVWT